VNHRLTGKKWIINSLHLQHQLHLISPVLGWRCPGETALAILRSRTFHKGGVSQVEREEWRKGHPGLVRSPQTTVLYVPLSDRQAA
jgi:hypothetical protein